MSDQQEFTPAVRAGLITMLTRYDKPDNRTGTRGMPTAVSSVRSDVMARMERAGLARRVAVESSDTCRWCGGSGKTSYSYYVLTAEGRAAAEQEIKK